MPLRCEWFTAVALTALLSAAPRADAHPHVWIDVTVAPVFDSEGRFAGVYEKWALDSTYTESVLPELDIGKDGIIQDSDLAVAGPKALWWIDSAYMTRITLGGQDVARGAVSDFTVRLTDRLVVEFTLPLAERQKVTSAVGIDVFDPENYYAFQFADPGITAEGLPVGCKAAPRPAVNLDPTAVAILKRLGLTADPAILNDPAAGFPVRVVIECQ
jgi:ABC-type uncharacterized transport system substrate-binding protein